MMWVVDHLPAGRLPPPYIGHLPRPKPHICQEDNCHPQFFSSFSGALFLAFSTYRSWRTHQGWEDHNDDDAGDKYEIGIAEISIMMRSPVALEGVLQIKPVREMKWRRQVGSPRIDEFPNSRSSCTSCCRPEHDHHDEDRDEDYLLLLAPVSGC